MLNAISSIPYRIAQQLAKECTPPPASPNAPGFKKVDVEPGPNHFQLGIQGPDPLLATGGTHDQQEAQRDTLMQLAMQAATSYLSKHTPLAPRLPSDDQVANTLNALATNPPIGADGAEVTHAVYQSTIPAATAQEAYEHFVQNPEQVFGAGAMEIRPSTERLQDGERYMLEIGGPVPTWLPVEIRLDPAKNAITINTLDGHVLRGEQTFTFTDDCNGGAVLTQDARFQASSRLPDELQQLTSISAGQHEGWLEAHREIYEQFNGDRDYQGMGIGIFNPQQINTWKEGFGNFVSDPGNAVDVTVDTGGEVINAASDAAGRAANWFIDGAGNLAGDIRDSKGLPGGDLYRAVADAAGDGAERAADIAGDVISDAADTTGDALESFVDSRMPYLR